jgi:uncharacterized OB-fold protein
MTTQDQHSDTGTDALIHEVNWTIDYRVRLGVAWSRFMRGLESKELWSSRCGSCSRSFVPPQSYCEHCYEPITDWQQVDPVGTLGASTIVYQGFQGGPEVPYAVGAIAIDGTDSQLMHFIGGVDLSSPAEAREQLRHGLRVQAEWAPTRTAGILDIRCFTPLT